MHLANNVYAGHDTTSGTFYNAKSVKRWMRGLPRHCHMQEQLRYDVHMRTQTKNLLQWDGCMHTAAQKHSLTMHTRGYHTLEHPWLCNWGTCQFCCATLEDVTKHKRFHTGEQMYWRRLLIRISQYFLYASANNINAGALTVHKGSRTGERPYTYNWPGCKFACSQKIHLTRHKRIHSHIYDLIKVAILLLLILVNLKRTSRHIQLIGNNVKKGQSKPQQMPFLQLACCCTAPSTGGSCATTPADC